MTEMVQYRVKRPFKYNGRWYKRGEVWEPTGSRFDAAIIRNGQVVTERLPEVEPPAPEEESPRPRREGSK